MSNSHELFFVNVAFVGALARLLSEVERTYQPGTPNIVGGKHLLVSRGDIAMSDASTDPFKISFCSSIQLPVGLTTEAFLVSLGDSAQLKCLSTIHAFAWCIDELPEDMRVRGHNEALAGYLDELRDGFAAVVTVEGRIHA
ncbi:hypothetical protein ACCS79_03620 [Rhizobium johnstonii]|uniref:hypothetical protein n=1 Tax=Rhizobium johnstonii TaxID=3019933 RepID=UPI003F9CCC7A